MNTRDGLIAEANRHSVIPDHVLAAITDYNIEQGYSPSQQNAFLKFETTYLNGLSEFNPRSLIAGHELVGRHDVYRASLGLWKQAQGMYLRQMFKISQPGISIIESFEGREGFSWTAGENMLGRPRDYAQQKTGYVQLERASPLRLFLELDLLDKRGSPVVMFNCCLVNPLIQWVNPQSETVEMRDKHWLVVWKDGLSTASYTYKYCVISQWQLTSLKNRAVVTLGPHGAFDSNLFRHTNYARLGSLEDLWSKAPNQEGTKASDKEAMLRMRYLAEHQRSLSSWAHMSVTAGQTDQSSAASGPAGRLCVGHFLMPYIRPMSLLVNYLINSSIEVIDASILSDTVKIVDRFNAVCDRFLPEAKTSIEFIGDNNSGDILRVKYVVQNMKPHEVGRKVFQLLCDCIARVILEIPDDDC